MPKRVAVIDLGSNSARMALFERTSRLGFFILREYKVRVRLGAGAYENGGVLQGPAMDSVLSALAEFKQYIKLYKVRKIIAGGTSALRDAPNAKAFVSRVAKELGINLRIISGKEEAFLGGLAAANLLPKQSEALCVDIGGGSTELAKIENGKITHTMSLNLGTVRLKELFYDKGDEKGAIEFIKAALAGIPKEYKSSTIIAIGGSLRCISQSIMARTNYALNMIHGFGYELKKHENVFKKLCAGKESDLKELGVKKERYDTIAGGANIFYALASKIGAKSVLTSGVGIREGLFLSNLLRPALGFPANFNPSLKSLEDRFCLIDNTKIAKTARRLFEVLASVHGLGVSELELLSAAARVFNIGRSLGYYQENANSAYFIHMGLSYGYTHEQICKIAVLCELNGKEVIKDDLGEFASIISAGSFPALRWLCFLLGLARHLGVYDELGMRYKNGALIISGAEKFLLLKDTIKKLPKPASFEIVFE